MVVLSEGIIIPGHRGGVGLCEHTGHGVGQHFVRVRTEQGVSKLDRGRSLGFGVTRSHCKCGRHRGGGGGRGRVQREVIDGREIGSGRGVGGGGGVLCILPFGLVFEDMVLDADVLGREVLEQCKQFLVSRLVRLVTSVQVLVLFLYTQSQRER